MAYQTIPGTSGLVRASSLADAEHIVPALGNVEVSLAGMPL